MKNKRVLVVCDDNVRRKFIERNILDYEFEPLRYPNFLAARKAIQLDSFAVIVIDLLMPIEQKLALVEEACKSQPGTPVIAVEKRQYLEETGFLSSHPSVVSLESMQMFPGELEKYLKKVDAEEKGG